jgi:hypothetical protein
MVRTSVRSFGQVVAADSVIPRSVQQHVRRGVGALILVGSEVAWRQTRFAYVTHFMRPSVRRELLVGFNELRAARRPRRLL